MLDELYHYGVVGMKWGIRRAKKKGTTYQYKSMTTKHYENKTNRLNKKLAKTTNANKAAKLQGKIERNKNYAKRSAELDRNMQKIAAKTSTGKALAQAILLGPAAKELLTQRAAKLDSDQMRKVMAKAGLDYRLDGKMDMSLGSQMKREYIHQDDYKKKKK